MSSYRQVILIYISHFQIEATQPQGTPSDQEENQWWGRFESHKFYLVPLPPWGASQSQCHHVDPTLLALSSQSVLLLLLSSDLPRMQRPRLKLAGSVRTNSVQPRGLKMESVKDVVPSSTMRTSWLKCSSERIRLELPSCREASSAQIRVWLGAWEQHSAEPVGFRTERRLSEKVGLIPYRRNLVS